MPTNAQLKTLTQEQLVDPVGLHSIPKTDIKGRIDAGYDYTDQQVASAMAAAEEYTDAAVGTNVTLQIARDGGGVYTVTNVHNGTGLTFTAADISTTGTGITASGAFFVTEKTFPASTTVRNSGVPYITYDGGFTSSTLRALYFYNLGTSLEARPPSFTITVSYTVYP